MRITEKVYVVGRSEWGGLGRLSRGFGGNIFLLNGGSELALVDVGMPEGRDDVLENVRKCGFDPARIKKILLTHAHWDHVGGLASYLHRLDAEVYGHTLTKETLAGQPGIYCCPLAYPMPDGVKPAPVHNVVQEGGVIQIGELAVKVWETPGHTPDGLVFVFGNGSSCFSGDTAIGDQGEVRGNIGWLDSRWRSNLPQYKATLERLCAAGFCELFPGHGISHLGRADVKKSLDNCLWRLNLLLSIPHLGSMLPTEWL